MSPYNVAYCVCRPPSANSSSHFCLSMGFYLFLMVLVPSQHLLAACREELSRLAHWNMPVSFTCVYCPGYHCPLSFTCSPFVHRFSFQLHTSLQQLFSSNHFKPFSFTKSLQHFFFYIQNHFNPFHSIFQITSHASLFSSSQVDFSSVLSFNFTT